MTRRTRSGKLDPPPSEPAHEALPSPAPLPVKAWGRPHKAEAAAVDDDSQPLAVPSKDTSIPQPKTKGWGLKRAAPALSANNNEETHNIVQDSNHAPPTKKPRKAATKSVKSNTHQKPVVESCEPLPARDRRNTHPGLIEGVAPVHRRTTAEVSAQRAAARKAAEDEIRRGEDAKRWLAEMEVDEERVNAEDEEKSTRHLSTVLENAHYPHTDDAKFFNWESGKESDSEPEVKKTTARVSGEP